MQLYESPQSCTILKIQSHFNLRLDARRHLLQTCMYADVMNV